MESMAFVLGAAALALALVALGRISSIEKKLKDFDVIPRDFDPDEESSRLTAGTTLMVVSQGHNVRGWRAEE